MQRLALVLSVLAVCICCTGWLAQAKRTGLRNRPPASIVRKTPLQKLHQQQQRNNRKRPRGNNGTAGSVQKTPIVAPVSEGAVPGDLWKLSGFLHWDEESTPDMSVTEPVADEEQAEGDANYNYDAAADAVVDGGLATIKAGQKSFNSIRKEYHSAAKQAEYDSLIKHYTTDADPHTYFHLERLVGAGKFGQVYAARYVNSSDAGSAVPVPVAIKTIPMWRKTGMTARELRALAIISRAFEKRTASSAVLESLPRCYGAFRNVDAGAPNGPFFWIPMEWIRGENLRELLGKHGAFSIPLIADVMRQILDAFIVLHDQLSIIHGDFVPQNIMLTRQAPSPYTLPYNNPDPSSSSVPTPGNVKVKLIDFGMSRMVGESAGRNIAWEMQKIGAIAYRMRYGDMPYWQNEEGEYTERMSLDETMENFGSSVSPPEFASFLSDFCGEGASARELRGHVFLRRH